MSSESTKIKEEPADKGYEQPVENVEPASESLAVKSEPKDTDEDDDYAWVNDELDFLNEIDDLVVTDDGAFAVPPVPVVIKQEPDTENACMNVSGDDKTTPQHDEEAPPMDIQIKVEKGVNSEPGGDVAATGSADIQNVAKDTPKEGASNNETPEAVISNSAGIATDRMNGCANNSNKKVDPSENNNTESIENIQLPTSDIANSTSASLQLNNSLQSPCPTGIMPFPVRIKQEKVSPPRELPAAPFPAYVTKQPPLPAGVMPLPIIEAAPLPPPPLPEEAAVLPPPPPEEKSPDNSFMNGVRIKQESLTPPRETTKNNATAESSTHPKRQRSLSKSPDRQTSATTKEKLPLDEDAAFLRKQREKILKASSKPDKPAVPSTSGEPSPKRRAINEIPMPIRIKSEPKDDYPTADYVPPSDCTPVDMELGSDQEQSPAKNSVMKNPLALKLMPQPLKVKTEPMDSYELGVDPMMMEPRFIKTEKLDGKPMSHRQRVLKFAKQTIKNMELFESEPKFKRRFLYTPVTLLRENAVKLNENRSPLNSSTGIQYEFSSQKLPLNTEQWGVCKLREPTAKIVRLLGFNAYEFSQRKKSEKLEKLDPEEIQQTPENDSSAYFMNSSTQTDELKCNRCIIRKLKKFVDRSTQASMPAMEATIQPSNQHFENVPHEMLETISQLSQAQQTALQEFTELIMGPSPTSTNDVQRMRERLMDIFTLAQSQSGNKGHSNSFEYSNKTPVSVLFNQPDHSRNKSMHQSSYHGSNSSLGKPIPTLNRIQPSHYQPSAGQAHMQQPQGSYHPVPPPVPLQYSHSAPLFPGAVGPQPVPPPYNTQQVYNPLASHDYQYHEPVGQMQDVNSMPGVNPMMPAMNPFPPRQLARDPRANAHLANNTRWS